MSTIKLQSSDGQIFPVDIEIAKTSETLKTMLEDLGITDETENEIVPLPNVNSEILKKVIDWAGQHKDDPVPTDEDEYKEFNYADLPEWDLEFLKMEQATLFELVLAANYLDIKGLLSLTCKSIANMIIGKTPEEIRKTFNVKCDPTPQEQEEEEVKKEIDSPPTQEV
jgi:S-phase kinase-associated protein 1